MPTHPTPDGRPRPHHRMIDRVSTILERAARAGVGVDIAGRHTRHSTPPSEPLEPSVASAIALEKWTLELDAQSIPAERFPQAPQRRLIVNSAQRAAAQADQAVGVVEDRFQSDVGL